MIERARQRGQTRFIGYSGDGPAARYAVECGRFDTLQTSINVADQEALHLTLPLAQARGVGVIAKRPIANAAWRTRRAPGQRLSPRLLGSAAARSTTRSCVDPSAESIGTALRFTASLPGVDTLVVGTTQPGRWRENAALLAPGALPASEMDAIRHRWKQIADDSWVGQR